LSYTRFGRLYDALEDGIQVFRSAFLRMTNEGHGHSGAMMIQSLKSGVTGFWIAYG